VIRRDTNVLGRHLAQDDHAQAAAAASLIETQYKAEDPGHLE